MGIAVTCSNKNFCKLADDGVELDPGLVACPRCSKLLASPHRLSITPAVGAPGGDAASVKIERISRPASVGVLELHDGRHTDRHPNPTDLREGAVWEVPTNLEDGRLLTAVLETTDGHRTIHSLPWFGYRRGGLLLLIVLLAIALLCLCVNFADRALLPWVPNDDAWAGLLLTTAVVGTLACAWLGRQAGRLGPPGMVVMILAVAIAIAFVVRQASLLNSSVPIVGTTAVVFLAFVAFVVVMVIAQLVAARRRSRDAHTSSGKQDAAE